MKIKNRIAILWAVLAAVLYAISSPLSKLLLYKLSSIFLAALLYIGAGFGMLIVAIVKASHKSNCPESSFTKKDHPYIIGMILLDIAAPILLMLGLSSTTAENASLLNNFEIVATSLIALLLFKEKISPRLWLSIALVTISSLMLSLEDSLSLSFSTGSLLVIAACVCWGLENNCTRALSQRNPLHVVVVKGLGSGSGSLIITLMLHQLSGPCLYILLALILGFFSYGLSIFFYVYAQRYLGAAKTSTYYAIAPFIGVLLSLAIFKNKPSPIFLTALAIMVTGSYLASTDVVQQP